jgi:hypothetical protein
MSLICTTGDRGVQPPEVTLMDLVRNLQACQFTCVSMYKHAAMHRMLLKALADDLWLVPCMHDIVINL